MMLGQAVLDGRPAANTRLAQIDQVVAVVKAIDPLFFRRVVDHRAREWIARQCQKLFHLSLSVAVGPASDCFSFPKILPIEPLLVCRANRDRSRRPARGAAPANRRRGCGSPRGRESQPSLRLCGRERSTFGSITSTTPSRKVALALVLSTSLGRLTVRSNAPWLISAMR